MSKGFGLQRVYKLTITTAIGGAADLAIPAASNRSARWQAATILNVIANPGIVVYQDKARTLGLGDSLEALMELGEQMAGDALIAEAHPDFVFKIAQRVALTKKGDRSVVVIDKLQEMMPQIKSHHFVATLYSPSGKGLLQYSNLTQLAEYKDWEKVR